MAAPCCSAALPAAGICSCRVSVSVRVRVCRERESSEMGAGARTVLLAVVVPEVLNGALVMGTLSGVCRGLLCASAEVALGL